MREYAMPAEPLGKVGAVVMFKLPAIATVNALLAVAEELSVTLAVKAKLPAAVGVPLIAPVAGFMANPLGRAPAVIDHV